MGKLYRDFVRQHSQAKGSARALLNVLADYATDDGLVWIARETMANDAGMSERTVTRALQTLCEDGRVTPEENIKGGRGRVPVYKIHFPECLKGDNVTPFVAEERVTNCPLKGDNLSIKGDKFVPIQSYARSEPQEPNIEPREKRARANVLSTREPAAKTLRHTSPHLQAGRFVNGYIPQGTGRNPVEVYYERFSINQDEARLNAIAEDDLTRLCPDLDKLREVVTAYSRTPFRLGNLQLILDWYRDGIPDKHKGEQRPAQAKLSDAQRSAIETRAKSAKQSIRTAEQFGGYIDPTWQQAIDTAKGYGLL